MAQLLEPGETVLQLHRPLAPEIREVMEETAMGEPFESNVVLDAKDLDLSEILAPISHPKARHFLKDDITSMITDLAELLGRRHLAAKLGVVPNDGCRKFHTDYVTLRLICTYAGPGTEWVRDEDVRRENLRRTDVDLETANRSVLREPDVVNHCGAGDILLLKGEVFEGNRGRGAVHRSPPLTHPSMRRLVLKIDPQRCC